MATIFDEIENDSVGTGWIGLRRVDGKYGWSNGDISEYRNFSRVPDGNLCFMKTESIWEGISCLEKRNFLCKRHVMYKGWLSPVLNYSITILSAVSFLTFFLCCCVKKPVVKQRRRDRVSQTEEDNSIITID